MIQHVSSTVKPDLRHFADEEMKLSVMSLSHAGKHTDNFHQSPRCACLIGWAAYAHRFSSGLLRHDVAVERKRKVSWSGTSQCRGAQITPTKHDGTLDNERRRATHHSMRWWSHSAWGSHPHHSEAMKWFVILGASNPFHYSMLLIPRYSLAATSLPNLSSYAQLETLII